MSIGRKQLNREREFHQALMELELARPVDHWTLFDGQRERTSEREPDRLKSKAMRRSALTGIRTVRRRQK